MQPAKFDNVKEHVSNAPVYIYLHTKSDTQRLMF